MSLGVEIAKAYKNMTVSISPANEENTHVWVSDHYSAFQLKKNQFLDFKFKWCSYSNNPIIEQELEFGTTIRADQYSGVSVMEKNIFSSVIESTEEKTSIVEITNFCKGEDRIFKTEQKIGLISGKYVDLLKNVPYQKLTGLDSLDPIGIWDQGELVALISPIRDTGLFEEVANIAREFSELVE